MIRKVSIAALAILAFGGQIAHAKQPCRDAKGRFAKCETVKKPKHCRDAKGKFTKCDVPSASTQEKAPVTTAPAPANPAPAAAAPATAQPAAPATH
ncbi:hypothetical protein [Swingsia samuiensis]|uniref:Phosphate starvation-inducible protein PsiF n=1 Tax=Swingsia samuiensis TaxID=1293412 RepID=A0A4Y6UH83_9PROT|nr:hypothetical protein [Swingsia samuiensis]QDH16384.1 hypothetical protein E3D00_01490 [Swingsia samuiensis]